MAVEIEWRGGDAGGQSRGAPRCSRFRNLITLSVLKTVVGQQLLEKYDDNGEQQRHGAQ